MRFIFRSSAHDYACVAQLVEQLTLNQWVRGSSPRARTINKTASLSGGCFINGNEDRARTLRGLEERKTARWLFYR